MKFGYGKKRVAMMPTPIGASRRCLTVEASTDCVSGGGLAMRLFYMIYNTCCLTFFKVAQTPTIAQNPCHYHPLCCYCHHLQRVFTEQSEP